MYKPDYGVKLFSDGVKSSDSLYFPNFRLYSITIIAQEQYTTMVEIPFDGEIYALSLDFNHEQLEKMLSLTNSIYKNVLLKEISKNPSRNRTIDLSTEIEINVKAHLGKLHITQNESYMPLILDTIESNLEPKSINEIVPEVETNISKAVGFIIAQLSEGNSSGLERANYVMCGDSTSMKVYELESFFLRKELDKLSMDDFNTIKTSIEKPKNYVVDDYEVFMYLQNKIDIYKNIPFTREDFLHLLDKQCWLETTIKECNEEFSLLKNELNLDDIELYNPVNLFVPEFALDVQNTKFFYIFGKDIKKIDLETYKEYFLFKLTFLITRAEVDYDSLLHYNLSDEDFEYATSNPRIYQQIPPYFLAKLVIKSKVFEDVFKELEGQIISLVSLADKELECTFIENYKHLFDLVEAVMDTTIYDVIFFEPPIHYSQ